MMVAKRKPFNFNKKNPAVTSGIFKSIINMNYNAESNF